MKISETKRNRALKALSTIIIKLEAWQNRHSEPFDMYNWAANAKDRLMAIEEEIREYEE